MSRFNDLVKEKKMKILILVLLLISSATFIKKTKSADISLITINKGEPHQHNCLIQKSQLNSGIAWIYPFSNNSNSLYTSTSFIPNLSSNLTCDFEPNSVCNTRWTSNRWKLESKSNLILDSRWEGFKTIFTDANASVEPIEITADFDLGFSVRTGSAIEIFLCEGWHPDSYPCYGLGVDPVESNRVVLKKYSNGVAGEGLEVGFVSVFSVLHKYEWRSFTLRKENSRISFVEVLSRKVLLKFDDDKPMKPLFLFLRSLGPTLWKLHSNSYLYTTEANFSKIGPTFTSDSTELCVALYISQCHNCSMEFYLLTPSGNKSILEISGKNKSNKWEPVTFTLSEIFDDELQLGIRTKSMESGSKGFWALDQTRVCHKDEVRLSKLFPPTNLNEKEITCHSVENPKWRPQRQVLSLQSDELFEFKTEAAVDSVRLYWSTRQLFAVKAYSIYYQGNDICRTAENKNRTKSSNYVFSNGNEAIISNLIPYTHYDFEISFIFTNDSRKFSENTLPTEIPSDAELPKNVSFNLTESKALISWVVPKCTEIYGPLHYFCTITNATAHYNQSTKSTERSCTFTELKPYANYSLEILTSRTDRHFFNSSLVKRRTFNFTTEASIADVPRNAEIYSSDTSSLSIRYDLPLTRTGILKYVQVIFCVKQPFEPCSSNVSAITPCKLWKHKYCIDLDDLVSFRHVTVSVSLKNVGTHRFGDAVKLDGNTFNRIPGKPTNITYKVVNCNELTIYCHLNVSWMHPYDQNATIDFFNLELKKNSIESDVQVSSYIVEVFKLSKNEYAPFYNYLIRFVPYSTTYNLSIQSANFDYKSNFTTVTVKTSDIGDHIDQSPKLMNISENTLTFELPKRDWRLNKTILYVVLQDYNESSAVDSRVLEELNLKKGVEGLCNGFGDTWIALKVLLPTESGSSITIGDGKTNRLRGEENTYINKPLQPETEYCVTFVMRNFYMQDSHTVIYYEKNINTKHSVETLPEVSKSNPYLHLYVLLVILLCVPFGFLIYRYVKKKKIRRANREDADENTYETLPFEEADNFAYNQTYDKLIHT